MFRSFKQIKFIPVLIAIGLSATFFYAKKNSSNQVELKTKGISLPTIGLEEVDQYLAATFLNLDQNVEIAVEEASGQRKVKFDEFLSMVKTQLRCPEDCEGSVLCKKIDKENESCEVEISRKLDDPKPGQDSEPGSIWTISLERKALPPHSLKPDSLTAIWRDF